MDIDKLTFDTPFNLTRRDIRDALGLTPTFRDYAWPALGMLTAGLAVGAGAALLLAPKSGEKLRAEISDEVRTKLDSIETRLQELISDGAPADEVETDEDIEVKAA